MARVIDSLATLAWPLIAVFLVIRLGPALRDVVRQREVQAKGGPGGFELTVGGQPVSGQQAIDDQRKETEALRAQLSILAAEVETLTTPVDAEEDGGPTTARAQSATGYPATAPDALLGIHRVVWVSGDPASYAYEVAALQDRGVLVVLSASNHEVIELLEGSQRFDALITDMQRVERGRPNSSAGLELITWMKSHDISIPTFIYEPGVSAQRVREAIAAGAAGVTSSLTELLEVLGVNFGPRSTPRLVDEIVRVLETSGGDSALTVEPRGDEQVDLLLLRHGRRIGIEAKAWPGSPSPGAVEAVLSRLSALVRKGRLDEGWLVTPMALPIGASNLAGAVRAFTLGALRDQLASDSQPPDDAQPRASS